MSLIVICLTLRSEISFLIVSSKILAMFFRTEKVNFFLWLIFFNRLIPSLNQSLHISSPHMCINVLFFGLDSKHQKIKINILKFSAKTFTHVYTHFNFCAHKFSMHFIFIRKKVMTLFSPSQTELKWKISSLFNPVDYI